MAERRSPLSLPACPSLQGRQRGWLTSAGSLGSLQAPTPRSVSPTWRASSFGGGEFLPGMDKQTVEGTVWSAFCISGILLDIYLVAYLHERILKAVSSTLQVNRLKTAR